MTANHYYHSYQEKSKVEKAVWIETDPIKSQKAKICYGLQKLYYIYTENGTKNQLKLLTKSKWRMNPNC